MDEKINQKYSNIVIVSYSPIKMEDQTLKSIPLKAGCHAQGPPTEHGLTALYHYQVHQVPRQRLIVGRQSERVQAEEHTVLHHSFVTKHTGHTHLGTGDHSQEAKGMKEVIGFRIKQGFNLLICAFRLDQHKLALKHNNFNQN